MYKRQRRYNRNVWSFNITQSDPAISQWLYIRIISFSGSKFRRPVETRYSPGNPEGAVFIIYHHGGSSSCLSPLGMSLGTGGPRWTTHFSLATGCLHVAPFDNPSSPRMIRPAPSPNPRCLPCIHRASGVDFIAGSEWYPALKYSSSNACRDDLYEQLGQSEIFPVPNLRRGRGYQSRRRQRERAIAIGVCCVRVPSLVLSSISPALV